MDNARESQGEDLRSLQINTGRMRHYLEFTHRVQDCVIVFAGPENVTLPPPLEEPDAMADVHLHNILSAFPAGEGRIVTLPEISMKITEILHLCREKADPTPDELRDAFDRICAELIDFVCKDLVHRNANRDINKTAAELIHIVAEETLRAMPAVERSVLERNLILRLATRVGELIAKNSPDFDEIEPDNEGDFITDAVNAVLQKVQELTLRTTPPSSGAPPQTPPEASSPTSAEPTN